jgi:hypothetical protein
MRRWTRGSIPSSSTLAKSFLDLPRPLHLVGRVAVEKNIRPS